MLTKLKLLSYIFLLTGLITACSEDGDPGVKGDKGDKGDPGQNAGSVYKKIGFLEGTIKGTQTDGTAFSKSFKYEYTPDSVESFVDWQGLRVLEVKRFGGSKANPALRLELTSPSEGVFEPTKYRSHLTSMIYLNKLNNDSLFYIYVRPFFYSTEAYVRELSMEKNKLFQFVYDSDGGYGQMAYDQDIYQGIPAYNIAAYQGDNYLNVWYSVDTGSLIGIHYNGIDIFSGDIFDLYNRLVFKTHPALGIPVFYDAADYKPLHDEVPAVPADQLTITNYSRDATTGIMTFDFEMKISGILSSSDRVNPTGHDLIVTGKFNSGRTVYKNVSAREKK